MVAGILEYSCFGGALRTVDCLGGASGKVLRLFSSWFSPYGRDTSLKKCVVRTTRQ
jgi:hypothetical protein